MDWDPVRQRRGGGGGEGGGVHKEVHECRWS